MLKIYFDYDQSKRSYLVSKKIETNNKEKIWDIYILDSRPKNSIQHLADIGITSNKRKEIIFDLEIENYNQGPLPETQFGGKEMWIFGKKIKRFDVYIKLTIVDTTNKAICISFHKAEHAMSFPFKS